MNPTPKHTGIDQQWPYAIDYRNHAQLDSLHEESQALHNQESVPIDQYKTINHTFGFV